MAFLATTTAAIDKFRAGFDDDVDTYINDEGDLYLAGKIENEERHGAICQIIASNAVCSKWTSGKLKYGLELVNKVN